MNGYILESKKILESRIWNKPPLYFKIWHYLLLKAQFSDSGNLKRGQLFTTINEIAEACSYYAGYRKVTPSKKEVWSVLEFLRNPCERDNGEDKTETMIETTKVTHGIIVTICNYCKYQDPKSYERNADGNNEIFTEELRNGQQGNNINNEYKESNKKNNKREIYKEKKPTPIRKQIPPTVEMVEEYCRERGNSVDAEKFCDFYTSKDWYVGKHKMTDWQASVRTWEKQNGDKVSSADKARIEKGRKAQEEAERKMEEEHKAEMEQYKKEHPDLWANMEEKAKTLSVADLIKKAVG